MAWYEGNCSTVNAGELITLLDTELVKNANWTIHDAAAGTNAKVYKNTNALKDFYLYVDDNQADYAFVSLYGAWDEETHTGSGNTIGGGVIHKGLSYGIHVDNDCFYLVFTDGKKTVFIGAIDSRDASKRLIIMVVGTSGQPSHNPIGICTVAAGCVAKALFDENGIVNNVFGDGSISAKDINGAPNLQVIVVRNASTYRVMGTIPGLTMSTSSTTDIASPAHGDTTTIAGVEWGFCSAQAGTGAYGANWYKKA